jgi:uroporphyrinogen-III synthase
MTHVLVLRPEPGACATLAAARGLGLTATRAPLFRVRPIAPDPAVLARPVDALLFTSANAARRLPPIGEPGDWAAPLRALPVYAVGAATAPAVRAAGWARVTVGDRDAASIVDRAAADGCRRLLHLAGREHRAVAHPGVTIERAILYAADAVDALPGEARVALAAGAVALLHSPRAAELFGRLVDAAGQARSPIGLAALSPAVAAAAGAGWAGVAVAAKPTDPALLAVLPKLCDGSRREA